MNVAELKGDLILVEVTHYWYKEDIEVLKKYFNEKRINYMISTYDAGSEDDRVSIEYCI